MGWFSRLLRRPAVAHWLRALDRFLRRLGFTLAAGLTFYAVLAGIPVIMVTFGVLGYVVTTWFPYLVGDTRTAIAEVFAAQPALAAQITSVLDGAFDSWRTVGPIGIPVALVLGTWWVGRTRTALRAMIRQDFTLPRDRRLRLRSLLRNLAILIGLQPLAWLTVALTMAATAARGWVRDGFEIRERDAWVLTVLPVAGALLSGFLLFALLFVVLPSHRLPGRVVAQAACLGAVGLTILQYTGGLIVGAFSSNLTAAVFGSLIIFMLVLNLFIVLLLVIAAWVGTIEEPDAGRAGIRAAERALQRAPLDYASAAIGTAMARQERLVESHAVVAAKGVGIGAGAAAGIVVALGLALLASALHRGALGLRAWSGSRR